MTHMTVRGLPRGLQRDAWWMAADARTGVGHGPTQSATAARPIGILIALIICVDVMMLRAGMGLGFVIAVLGVAAGAHWVVRAQVGASRARRAWAVLLISVLPAIDVLQVTSFMLAWVGLTVFAVMLTGDRILAAAARLPFLGGLQTLRDLRSARINNPNRSSLLDWVLPVGVGVIFAGLIAVANPVVGDWLSHIDFDAAPTPERVVAWGIIAVVIWPLLRLGQMALHGKPARPRATVARVGMINVRSVMRALVVFNLLFAAQTMMDIGYLWGGVRLPDGMTYAAYAHRGAYPLMITALLAGGFALVAQPWLDGQKMRALLLVWIAQTLVLVMSSILRLDLYVGAYGLTQMRFAAFVWMAVVALGLVVLIMQVVGRKDASWMLMRSFGIGVFAIYMCSLTNISGVVARHQITTGPLDVSYVCRLGEGATVAIARHAPDMCRDRYYKPQIAAPTDMRNWGFRNARLRHTLKAMKSRVDA